MAFLRFLAATAVALGAAIPPVYFSASAGQLAYTTPRAVIAFREPQDHLTPRGVSDQLTQGDVDTRLNVTIYNGQSGLLYAYITALDPINGDYHVLYHQGNDSYTWQVKPDGDSPVPVYFTLGDNNYQIELAPRQNTSLYLPSYAASGRIYIANGLLQFGTTAGGPDNGFVQPSVSNPGLQEYNTSYQFVEFTYLEGNFYTDISNVDFVSIPLGISVVSATGLTTTVQGLVANATASICNALAQQTARDLYNWAKLCVYLGGKLVRVLSPTQYLTMYPYDNLSTYYDNYVNEVWSWYKWANLTIDTQDSGPLVENATGANSSADTGFITCNTNNAANALICQQGSTQYAFPRPTTEQVFGCVQGA